MNHFFNWQTQRQSIFLSLLPFKCRNSREKKPLKVCHFLKRPFHWLFVHVQMSGVEFSIDTNLFLFADSTISTKISWSNNVIVKVKYCWNFYYWRKTKIICLRSVLLCVSNFFLFLAYKLKAPRLASIFIFCIDKQITQVHRNQKDTDIERERKKNINWNYFHIEEFACGIFVTKEIECVCHCCRCFDFGQMWAQ